MSFDDIYDELSKANTLCNKYSYNVLLICSSKYQTEVDVKFEGRNNTFKIISKFENLNEVYALKLENKDYASYFGKDADVLETIRSVIAKC
jgi:hypothetical protein